MRVDRATRADLGIWLRPIDGGPARQVLDPLPADGRFGRTWSTEFAWALDGRPAGRPVVRRGGLPDADRRPGRRLAGDLLDAPDLGVLVGVDGDRVVTYGACRGLPCPIVSTDVRTGGAADARAERRAGRRRRRRPTGARLVDETAAATGRVLRSVAARRRRRRSDLGPIPDGLGLGLGPQRSAAATRLPTGWVLLAPDGRLPADGRRSASTLRHIPDGMAVPLDEAIR